MKDLSRDEALFHVEQYLKEYFPGLSPESFIANTVLIEEEYFKWNSKINISAIREHSGFWVKHVIDSLCLCHYLRLNNTPKQTFYDIGSGAGFPGLIMSLCLDAKIYLVEPVKKKGDFISRCLRKLGLNAELVNKRYQDISSIEDQSVIVSRALGSYSDMCRYFLDIDKRVELILMTTRKELEKMPESDHDETDLQ